MSNAMHRHKDKVALRRAVAALGLADMRLEQGRKHYILRCTAEGRELVFTVAATPSDPRSTRNMLADIKRAARALRQGAAGT
jgi:hypothetical protein